MSSKKLFGFSNINHIHFIGISGISMSGLAEILNSQGYTISGSDTNLNSSVSKLQYLDVTLYKDHCAENITSPDLIVYTAAIKDNNPELVEAYKKNIPTIERADLLGKIMGFYQQSIAVSGTHGKTTTTSMLAMTMLESKLEPTIHIGGNLEAIGGSTLVGKQSFFITEACEYVESFLKFTPSIAVLLNIEEDHLDYYKNIDHIKSSFFKFIKKIPVSGYLVACIDDPNVSSIISNDIHCNLITYSIHSTNAYYYAKNIVFDQFAYASFDVYYKKNFLANFHLNVPGMHNVSNALASIATTHILTDNVEAIKNGLLKFKGTKRRFEKKGFTSCNALVVDDYAHHPSEIQATLLAIKNMQKQKTWCVFQPHTYTRTKTLIEDFSKSFYHADHVIITDIYAARELDTGEIHAKDLVSKINTLSNNATYIQSFTEIINHLKSKAQAGDIIITMGAGNVFEISNSLVNQL